MRYLGFDLETGGFDMDNHTINEAYFAIWDEDWNLLEDLHLLLKNDEGLINGSEEAYKITGIDPKEHLENPNTITYSEGRQKLIDMLERHKIPKKRNHYRFLGQNIMGFDIPFMERQGFFTQEDRKKCGINHNSLDTTCIVTWLKDIGALPSTVGNLGSLVKYLELPQGTAHRAKDDVHMQKAVYIKLCSIIKNSMESNLRSYGEDSDLLKIVEL
jgi:DNA polymerase III alpha subunit (gram-positive type)